MAFGPMPEDRTQVGGLTSSQNTTDIDRHEAHSIESAKAAEDTRNRKRDRQRYLKSQQQTQEGYEREQATKVGTERYDKPPDTAPPLEQHSPTQIHVPAWKTVIIGGSGGVRIRGYYRD